MQMRIQAENTIGMKNVEEATLGRGVQVDKLSLEVRANAEFLFRRHTIVPARIGRPSQQRKPEKGSDVAKKKVITVSKDAVSI